LFSPSKFLSFFVSMFHFMFLLYRIIIYMCVLSLLSLVVRDTTWKSICEKKRERERLRVFDHEVREKATDRFFSSSSSPLSSSSRSENATKCKSSHVLRTFTVECRNNWTNCFYWWIHTNQQQVWFQFCFLAYI